MKLLWPLLALCVVSARQAPFKTSESSTSTWDFDTRPNINATGNFIFESVGSLLQHWPNTRFRNGHTLVPATVPVGTLLYHGRVDNKVPTVPQWTATDAEHALQFARESPTDPGKGAWLLTLVTIRPLKLVYFDGTSAGNTQNGTMDSQDIVAWGKVMPELWLSDYQRLDMLCEWGNKYNIDGYVRMEMDFEVLLCDFTAGVEVSSFIDIPNGRTVRMPRPGREYVAGSNEVMLAGSWHNRYPGDPRIHLDLTGLVSFYDTALVPSLVEHRFGVERYFHRLHNISQADTNVVLGRLEEIFSRPASAIAGSGVDWSALIRVITNRFADRLEMVQYLLSTSKEDKAERVQTQLRYMLQPYILHGLSVVADELTWAEPVFEACALSHVKFADATQMTASETVIHGAIEDTTREICRVVTRMWAHGVQAGVDVVLNTVLECMDETVTCA